jgi:hypothetical protein
MEKEIFVKLDQNNQLFLLATMITGPNAGDITPSRVFFNLQRRKIYNIQCTVFTYGVLKCEKSFTWGGGLQCKVQTLLYSGPMLKIDCLLSHKPLAPFLPQAHPLQSHIHTMTHM